MKLITEQIDPMLLESGKDSKGLYIEGIFMQAEKRNRNGRIYQRDILEMAVDKYVTEQVEAKRAVGELNHPESPTVNYKEVSHLITQLEWKGNDVIGKARILQSLPNGKIVAGLIEDGVQIGVSSRGMGSLRTVEGVNYVSKDFVLNTVDIVHDPSASDAFVDGIYEGREWVQNAKGAWVPKGSETTTKQNFSGTELSEGRRLHEMKEFLSRLI